MTQRRKGMILTAHGGAMGTGRNSHKFFEEILKFKGTDAIEVDVRKVGSRLFLGHSFVPLLKEKRISIKFVLDYCVKNGLKVNCDLKRAGLIEYLARDISAVGAQGHVYITGNISKKELKKNLNIPLFVNDVFYLAKFGPPRTDNLERIKEYLNNLNFPDIAGLNVSKTCVSSSFLKKASDIGLQLSVYTVDDEATLRMLISAGITNITTNNIQLALKLKKEMLK